MPAQLPHHNHDDTNITMEGNGDVSNTNGTLDPWGFAFQAVQMSVSSSAASEAHVNNQQHEDEHAEHPNQSQDTTERAPAHDANPATNTTNANTSEKTMTTKLPSLKLMQTIMAAK